MSDEICAKFRVVIEKTQAAAFASFNACKDGTGLLVFFSRYVGRMLGTSLPFAGHSTFEDDPSAVSQRDGATRLGMSAAKSESRWFALTGFPVGTFDSSEALFNGLRSHV